MPLALLHTSRMKQHKLFGFLVLLSILFSARGVLAQRQRLLNPAEGANFWLTSMNPAAMSFGPSRLVLGTEILHAAFVPERALGLNEHRLHLTFPYWLPLDLAFGLDLRSFNAPIYSEIEASLLFSKKIFSQLALGMKLGLEGRAFDRSQFTLVDPNDPLLQGNSLRRNTPNVGLGLYWHAGAFHAGASLNHLNQPNLGYASKALQPRFVAFGLAYDLGLFTPSVSWNDDGAQQLLGFELAANVSKLAALRFSYERSGPLRLETQFHFHRNAKLAYGVNFPSGAIGAASSGTHELAYEHVLGREPEIGAPLLVLSTNRMNITIARHQRIAEAGVPIAVMNDLPGLAAEYLDPEEQLGNLVVVPLVGIAAQVSPEHAHEFYRALSASATFLLQEHAMSNVAVRVASGASEEARMLEKILRQNVNGNKLRVLLGYQKSRGVISLKEFRAGKTTIAEQTPSLSHETMVLNLVVPGRRRHVREWQLDILAPGAAVMKSFQGTGTLPSTLEWDWRNTPGKLVPAGQYRCKLNVQSKAGKKYSAIADVEITLTRREVTLRLTNKPKASEQQSARTDASTR